MKVYPLPYHINHRLVRGRHVEHGAEVLGEGGIVVDMGRRDERSVRNWKKGEQFTSIERVIISTVSIPSSFLPLAYLL